jgi:hypothetical protein
MNTMIDQLWFIEDQFNTNEMVKLKTPTAKKCNRANPVQTWAEDLGNQIGEFNINPKRRMIEDALGESVMPIFPHFIGAPEALILQEIYAHLGE